MILNNTTMIADRYEILGRVGSGGMADVYKAMDHTLGRYVAIKVLKEEYTNDMSFVSKFRTEAQSAAGLEHPNIVNVYDVGSQQGMHYIVMEFVEGITLKDYIAKKGHLNYKETLSIAIQVSRGIEAAHEKNIIHRDIKPQNIIISMDGKVKVTDFGIAKAVSENTIHSDVMGSVHYASPEQARNGYVSGKSDIYSLGIVMYEMVTGRVPYDGDSTVQVAIRHLQDEMVPPSSIQPDVPISIEKIILKCTHKSPDRRYESMESLLIDLRKSLINPYEDFVTDASTDGATRVISEDELDEIKEKTSDNLDEMINDEDDEDEGGRFLNPRTEKIVMIMGIIVVIVIIVVVILILGNIFGLFHFGSSNKNATSATEESGDTVEMIDLKGMTIGEAEAALTELGLSVSQSGTQASTLYDEGEIISQDIEEGETVAVGSTINVVVSSGESGEETEVPDVVGYSSSEAMSMLEDANLSYQKEFEYSDSVEAGDVIRQDPEAGETINEGDTVTIYISQGEDTVQVPSVVGYSKDQAKSTLTNAGFEVKVTKEYSDTVDKGYVISQSPKSGKYKASGSTVTITVSKGAETVVYSYSAKISAPTNVTVTYANIQLYGSDGETVIKSWSKVTSFPYKISVSNIKNDSSGTLVITWHFTDSNGNADTDVQEESVTFTKSS